MAAESRLRWECRTDLTLATNALGVVGGLLLVVATASTLLGVDPTERLLYRTLSTRSHDL